MEGGFESETGCPKVSIGIKKTHADTPNSFDFKIDSGAQLSGLTRELVNQLDLKPCSIN